MKLFENVIVIYLILKYVRLFAHIGKSKIFFSFLNLNGKHF